MLIRFDALDSVLNESGAPAKALVKATPISRFDTAVANKMSCPAFDKVRGLAIWAEKTRPVVFGSIIT
jgi:hypothetical protein